MKPSESARRKTNEKLLLVWVKSQLWSPLSRTVLREIAAYVGFRSFPLFCDEQRVLRCDVDERRWVPLGTVKLSSAEQWVGVAIGEEAAFICIAVGTYNFTHPFTVSFELIDGQAADRTELMTPRHDFGIFYNTVFDCVYIFGGFDNRNTSAGESYKESNSYSLHSKEWTMIAGMTQARYAFTPVAHAEVIYLCGGGTPTVETYNPFSDTYTPLPAFSLPATAQDLWECSAAVGELTLLVLTENAIVQWEFARKQVETRSLQRLPAGWRSSHSPCPPVVRQERLYLVDCFYPICRALSLRTGEFLFDVR